MEKYEIFITHLKVNRTQWVAQVLGDLEMHF